MGKNMKKILAIAILGMCCAFAWAEESYHIFTDTEGRVITARILTFDARKQVIMVQMENGRQGKIPLSTLSDADKEYVDSWSRAQDFMNKSRFKISVERNRDEDDSLSGHRFNKDLAVREVHYEITLDNRSDTEFSKVKVSYCIFYEQEDFDSPAGKVVCKQGVYCGTLDAGSLTPRSVKMLATQVVKVFREELDAGWSYTSGSDNVKHGEVHGVWVRAYLELPGGEKLMRELSLPESLPNCFKWTGESVYVGINK